MITLRKEEAMIPPALFIEIALLRLGKEIADGLDHQSRTGKVTQIITFWHNMREVDNEIKDFLLVHWQELLLEVLTHERELEIRKRVGNTDTEDLRSETRTALTTFYKSIGDCLKSLANTLVLAGG